MSELVSGVLIGVGGALLLTWLVTDAIGFALLMPQARQWLPDQTDRSLPRQDCD